MTRKERIEEIAKHLLPVLFDRVQDDQGLTPAQAKRFCAEVAFGYARALVDYVDEHCGPEDQK